MGASLLASSKIPTPGCTSSSLLAQGVRSHFGAARYLENVIRSFISVELVDLVVAWSAELLPTDRDHITFDFEANVEEICAT
jgi:hypothetical protein